MLCVLNKSSYDENCFNVYDGIIFDFFHLLFLCPSDQSEVSWSRCSANESPPCPPTAPQVMRPSCSSQSAPCTCSARHWGSMSSRQTARQHTNSYGRFLETGVAQSVYLSRFLAVKGQRLSPCRWRGGGGGESMFQDWFAPTLFPAPQKAEPACRLPLPNHGRHVSRVIWVQGSLNFMPLPRQEIDEACEQREATKT